MTPPRGVLSAVTEPLFHTPLGTRTPRPQTPSDALPPVSAGDAPAGEACGLDSREEDAKPAGAVGAPHVAGVDLSMRSTGIASSHGWTERVTSVGKRDDTLAVRRARLRQIAATVEDHCKSADLVVLEGPSYASAGSAGTWDRAGLWWMVVDRIGRHDIPIVIVPPASRCRYATGRGNASKDEVLAAAIRRFPDFDITGNDVADSVILMAAGRDALGHPLAVVPATHRKALDAVVWPEIGSLS